MNYQQSTQAEAHVPDVVTSKAGLLIGLNLTALSVSEHSRIIYWWTQIQDIHSACAMQSRNVNRESKTESTKAKR